MEESGSSASIITLSPGLRLVCNLLVLRNASIFRPNILEPSRSFTFRLAAGMPDPLQWQTTKQDTLLVCVAVGESGSWIGISTSPSLRQFHDVCVARLCTLPTSRATSVAHVLWWPRRSLATLDRKSRQGRKAATVSIDAGAEVNRRGHHPLQV